MGKKNGIHIVNTPTNEKRSISSLLYTNVSWAKEEYSCCKYPDVLIHLHLIKLLYSCFM